MFLARDVSAVVCTLNSANSLEECLKSLRNNAVGQLVVVDGGSTDQTVPMARRYADVVTFDDANGLGAARAKGIALTTGGLVLNCGSDNVFPDGALDSMLACYVETGALGVSARTRVQGSSYLARSLDHYRQLRFEAGPRAVIGTPTLMDGHRLREDGFDPSCTYSDDAELCERWIRDFSGEFFICDTEVWETGKTSLPQVLHRWSRVYGTSDHEVFRRGRSNGWTLKRSMASTKYPLVNEFIRPFLKADPNQRLRLAPFLATITIARYAGWLYAAIQSSFRKSLAHIPRVVEI